MKKVNKKTEKKENKAVEIVGKGVNPRGRSFEGEIIKKFSDRVVIQFERVLYLRKYERYEKRKTKLQVKITSNFKENLAVGDYIEVKECKPLSKSIHFIVTKKIRSVKNESN